MSRSLIADWFRVSSSRTHDAEEWWFFDDAKEWSEDHDAAEWSNDHHAAASSEDLGCGPNCFSATNLRHTAAFHNPDATIILGSMHLRS
jgi:hypothetical protein